MNVLRNNFIQYLCNSAYTQIIYLSITYDKHIVSSLWQSYKRIAIGWEIPKPKILNSIVIII